MYYVCNTLYISGIVIPYQISNTYLPIFNHKYVITYWYILLNLKIKQLNEYRLLQTRQSFHSEDYMCAKRNIIIKLKLLFFSYSDTIREKNNIEKKKIIITI